MITAHEDTSLVARVVRRTPLLYTAGADHTLDRPAHVRAGSGLARIGDRIVVVQDDANFIAVVDAGRLRVDAVTLPPGQGGLRQFDDLRGNKRFKLDLEGCASLPHERIIAFGSGSSRLRESIMVMSGSADGYSVELIEAASLYAMLRASREFAGSEMNIEGVVYLDGMIRLFNRGNGLAREGFEPVNATCDLEWQALEQYLTGGCSSPPPPILAVRRYHLGSIEGITLGFTDAEVSGGRIYFTAAAEDSTDAIQDGDVLGSALGFFESDEALRWTTIIDEQDNRFDGKVEGLLIEPDGAWGVLDSDDPRVPSELCRIELTGFPPQG